MKNDNLLKMNDVKDYWERQQPVRGGRSNGRLLWFKIYTCIIKQCEKQLQSSSRCPSCTLLIDYDIKDFKYCKNCGQKLTVESRDDNGDVYI